MVNPICVSKDQFYNSKVHSFLFGALIFYYTLLNSSVAAHGKEKKDNNFNFFQQLFLKGAANGRLE